jgi:hypothetical protein
LRSLPANPRRPILQLKKTAPLVPHSALGPSGACEDGLAAVSMARAEM